MKSISVNSGVLYKKGGFDQCLYMTEKSTVNKPRRSFIQGSREKTQFVNLVSTVRSYSQFS